MYSHPLGVQILQVTYFMLGEFKGLTRWKRGLIGLISMSNQGVYN